MSTQHQRAATQFASFLAVLTEVHPDGTAAVLTPQALKLARQFGLLSGKKKLVAITACWRTVNEDEQLARQLQRVTLNAAMKEATEVSGA